MATLDNLTNLIADAKNTTSGKIEWTDSSLKGIQKEIEYLFSQNAIQVVPTTNSLVDAINDNSQLAFVTSDANLSVNGIYYWSLTQESAINYPAGSNGFWNLIEFGIASSIPSGYIPYSNGTNLVQSYLKRTINEIKMEGGSFVANNSLSSGPYFQAGDTDSIGNDIIFTINDNTQIINTKKATANKGIKLDFSNNIYKIGDIDNNKGLSIDTSNNIFKLGDTSTSEGCLINLNTGYLGKSSWNYGYTATTLVAGNSSINLTLNDTSNLALLGTSTKGLSVDAVNDLYVLGDLFGGNGAKLTIDDANVTVILTSGLSANTSVTLDDSAQTALVGTSTKGLFTDSVNNIFKLGNISTSNGLVVDTAGTYKLGNNIKGLYIDTASDSYKLGNYTSNIGIVLGATTGYLGSATFGYNYTATSLVVGNSSINVTLDDVANTAYVGTATQGLLVDATNSLYKIGNLSTNTGLSLTSTTGYLGNSTFGYNFTANTLIAGNSSINLTLNDSLNKANLGTSTKGVVIDVNNSVYSIGDLFGGNSSILTIDDANAFAVLKTGVSNSDCSLQLDHQAASVILSAGVTNNTALTLNDSTDTLQVDAANITINSTLDVAPGKSYTQRSIPVTVNGVSYYIPLYL